MSQDPSFYVGMSEADKARCVASDTNLAGIIQGRRTAASLLLARDPVPAQEVHRNWYPVLQVVKPGAPLFTVPDLAPYNVLDADWLTGSGPPPDDAPMEYGAYLDDVTGDVYVRDDL